MGKKNRATLIAIPVLLGITACGAERAESEQFEVDSIGTLQSPIISTWYDSSSRKIYANGEGLGTLNVRMTYKRFGTTCKTETRVMNRVPDAQMNASLCASVMGVWVPITGTIQGCVSRMTRNPINAFYYNFTSAIDTQLNYKAFYWDGVREVDTSGWQPSAGNGCPKT